MRKKNLKSLTLNKSSVSNLNIQKQVKGGTGFTVVGECAEIHPSSFQAPHLGILGCEAACIGNP